MSTGVQFEREILEEAATSPVVAIMRLTLEVDRELRKILGSNGLLDKYGSQTLPEALELLRRLYQLPRELVDTVAQFWSLRNFVVHGQVGGEQVPLRALDYGLRILRMLQSLPRPTYRVMASGVPLYSDSQCTQLRPDVRGVILETFGPEGDSHGKSIFPTTRSYSEGTNVTWEWNLRNRKGWGDTWYRDPETHEVKLAWNGALEFVGRDLDEV